MTAYGDIVAGCKAAVESVPSVNAVLLYEPAQIQAWPLVYITLDTFTRTQAGQITTMRPRIRLRLLVPIPTSEDLEIEAVEIAFAIADAVDANPQFSGVIVSGLAQVPDGRAGYITVGGAKYRAIDIFADCLFKQAYTGAL
jgi:hypothetical protein